MGGNKPPRKKAQNDKKRYRNRSLIVISISMFLLIAMGFILIGAINYRVLRVRTNINFEKDSDYIVREILIAKDVVDPRDEDDTWYFNVVGGAYNYIDFEGGLNISEAKEDFIQDFYERLQLEIEIESIYIIFLVVPKSNINKTLAVISEEIELGLSTDIKLDSYDYDFDEIEYELTDLSAGFILEALFNIV